MNRISELLGIQYPVIQAGMIWCSGWKLAAAVSKAGGLGVIGAGSMYPNVLEEHLQKIQSHGVTNFGVNLPLLYPQIDDHIELLKNYKVKVAITSAGNPAKYTDKLKSAGLKVIHVISNEKFALKAQEAGVDAIIAEGFEAGGHNGAEENTTFTLLPRLHDLIHIPLMAAGGIYNGRTFLAARILGADGVQIGSRFVCAEESSAHENFKQAILQAKDGDTSLRLKQLVPVRLLHNEFAKACYEAEQKGSSKKNLLELLGRGRAKKGMFEGDMIEGELEIGQVAAAIRQIQPAGEILKEIMNEYEQLKKTIPDL